ncbi:maleylpyruvate isomerase family mycothiol-dependent enzyme [Actinophytocola glycyrrhizae]|uniref:Maleylpyruvate isomerase family mycothiol-dependent enzyme n=1 Tax=Actinophytocola glycyrrhizae TaxID=2044873 RepID=A0ABV9SDI0_9PSEU
MSISPEASVGQNDVPAQRRADERSAAERAVRLLPLVRQATERLDHVVAGLDENTVHQPSGLPGWSRAHVVSHLARNADGLVNLLTWARTGVEHPMYASTADRDADIEEGAGRLAQILVEDLRAASDRLMVAATGMPEHAWSAPVMARLPASFPAANIPSMRLHEVWVHLVDLDAGFSFDQVPNDHLEHLVAEAVTRHINRPDGKRVRLTVELPGDRERVWDLVNGGEEPRHDVTGDAATALAWLTGRSDGTGLRGDVPVLPAWG